MPAAATTLHRQQQQQAGRQCLIRNLNLNQNENLIQLAKAQKVMYVADVADVAATVVAIATCYEMQDYNICM